MNRREMLWRWWVLWRDPAWWLVFYLTGFVTGAAA